MAKQDQIGDVPGNILGMLADLNHKIQHGQLTPQQLGRFLKKENPFATPQKLSVNGNDPRFQTILKDAYYYVNSNLKIKHFPLTYPSVRDVEYEIVEFDHDPTTQETLDACETTTLRRPERDEAETYFDNVADTKDQLAKSPIVALCGSFLELSGDRYVACAELRADGRGLYLDDFVDRWRRRCRFLAVRKSAL